MLDKSHCMMNMEDEDEYLDFYDFTKTYENHPDLIIDEKAIEEQPQAEEEGAKEEDTKDGGMPGSDEDWDDCELEEEDVASDKEGDESSLVEVSDIQIDSKADKPKFEEKKGSGVTREEAFLGLNIKKAKYLSTGEI